MRILMRLGIRERRNAQKFCSSSCMLLNRNTQDGAVSFSFLVSRVPPGIDADAALRVENSAYIYFVSQLRV
jgi:hypothetical protein